MPKGQYSEVMTVENSSAEGIACKDIGFDIEADMVDSTLAPTSSHQADLHGLVSPPRAPSPPYTHNHHSAATPHLSIESHLQRLVTKVHSMREE